MVRKVYKYMILWTTLECLSTAKMDFFAQKNIDKCLIAHLLACIIFWDTMVDVCPVGSVENLSFPSNRFIFYMYVFAYWNFSLTLDFPCSWQCHHTSSQLSFHQGCHVCEPLDMSDKRQLDDDSCSTHCYPQPRPPIRIQKKSLFLMGHGAAIRRSTAQYSVMPCRAITHQNKNIFHCVLQDSKMG